MVDCRRSQRSRRMLRCSRSSVRCTRPPRRSLGGARVRNGSGDKKRNFARMELVFDAQPITGEVWREVQGSHEGARAWRVLKQS